MDLSGNRDFWTRQITNLRMFLTCIGFEVSKIIELQFICDSLVNLFSVFRRSITLQMEFGASRFQRNSPITNPFLLVFFFKCQLFCERSNTCHSFAKASVFFIPNAIAVVGISSLKKGWIIFTRDTILERESKIVIQRTNSGLAASVAASCYRRWNLKLLLTFWNTSKKVELFCRNAENKTTKILV